MSKQTVHVIVAPVIYRNVVELFTDVIRDGDEISHFRSRVLSLTKNEKRGLINWCRMEIAAAIKVHGDETCIIGDTEINGWYIERCNALISMADA